MIKVTFQLEFDSGKSIGSKYKIEAIYNSVVYAKEADVGDYLSGFYYLIS